MVMQYAKLDRLLDQTGCDYGRGSKSIFFDMPCSWKVE